MKGDVYHLNKWSVSDNADYYTAPEAVKKVLIGIREEDGKQIVTSYIVSVDGREVHTYSGSTYILGEIDFEYKKYLENNGLKYNYDNPIKVKF